MFSRLATKNAFRSPFSHMKKQSWDLSIPNALVRALYFFDPTQCFALFDHVLLTENPPFFIGAHEKLLSSSEIDSKSIPINVYRISPITQPYEISS